MTWLESGDCVVYVTSLGDRRVGTVQSVEPDGCPVMRGATYFRNVLHPDQILYTVEYDAYRGTQS